LLLQTTAGASTDAILQLLTLRLQYCGSQQRYHLTLLQSAQNLGVVEVADANAHQPRRVVIVFFHEDKHRSACSTGESASAASTASTLTIEAARTACTAPAAAALAE